jgi:predicted secreted protein
MSVFTGILLYVIIWWVVLFMVLPWKAHPPETPETGHAQSAPERPMLWRKAAATTAIAAVLWVGAYWLIAHSDLIQFRGAIPLE